MSGACLRAAGLLVALLGAATVWAASPENSARAPDPEVLDRLRRGFEVAPEKFEDALVKAYHKNAKRFSIPGFHSGWFLLRNRRRSFVAIADGRRKLWLPGSGRHDLLIEPADPAALLARLRELATHSGRG